MMDVIVSTYGSKLSIRDGLLRMSQGSEVKEIPLHRITSIQLTKAASLSTEVMRQAIERQIDILIINRRGNPIGRVWSVKYGTIASIRKSQVRFAQSPEAVKWVKELVSEKIKNQMTLPSYLAAAKSESEGLLDYTEQCSRALEQLEQLDGNTVDAVAERLRGIEGNQSRLYFRVLANMVPSRYRFAGRSRQPAKDMFNAMLNYAYGILYGKVEGALIRAGLDPYTGVFHADDYNTPVLVFDFIEYFRVWADYVVMNLLMQEIIFEEFFEIKKKDFYLNEMGKAILIPSMAAYMEEIVPYKGLERSRNTHINICAQKFAQQLNPRKP